MAYKNEEYLAEHQSWTKAYVERMMNMVLRDRNHACVITWSLGNESSHGMNIEAMADWARANDPTSLAHQCVRASLLDPQCVRSQPLVCSILNLSSACIVLVWPRVGGLTLGAWRAGGRCSTSRAGARRARTSSAPCTPPSRSSSPSAPYQNRSVPSSFSSCCVILCALALDLRACQRRRV